MDNITSNAQLINDLFITACEGGINHWCKLENYDYKNTTSNYKIFLTGAEGYADNTGTITDKTIVAGIKKLQSMNTSFSRRVLSDIINEDFDAVTGDIVLQLGLFNDIIFG